MARRSGVLAVLGVAFVASMDPAAAAVPHPEGAPAVAHSENPSEAETTALDSLLERSGLRVQLDSLSAGVRLQFLRGRSRLSGPDRVTIDRIVTERFAPETLYARIRLELERNLDAAKLAKALDWYDSPLGKRITALELAALDSDGGLDADLEADRSSPRRFALLQRLDAGGAASETTVDITIAIVRRLMGAIQPVLPAAARLSRSQLEAQLTQARDRALEPMRRACLVSMLFAYRDLSEGELDRYVQFVESEAGQWYMSVMNSTLLTAIDAAAEATAAELVTAVPQLVGDLR